MYLRNGKAYYNPGSIDNIIKLQAFFRAKVVHEEYLPYLQSIKMIRKRFPHLTLDRNIQKVDLKKYKTAKKQTKKKKNTKIINKLEDNELGYNENDVYINDDEYIINQYESLKNMGSNIINGRKRSSRSNKGTQPDRYVDENFLEIILEDSKIDEILESGSDVDTDYHSDNDFSDEDSDGEWDENYQSPSEDEWSEDEISE